MTNRNDSDEDLQAPVQEHNEIERGLFGRWTIILRNVGGMLAIVTMCVTSVLNGWTTHVSVADKGIWPSEITVFITNIGLVVCAWTWLSSQKIIKTIFDGTGSLTKIRERTAAMIAPRPPDTSPEDNNAGR